MQQAHRLVTLHIGKLMRVVMRQQKHAVFLPFESLLGPLLARPNGGETAAFDDIDDFVKGKFKRWQSLARGNFRDASRSDTLLTDELDECRVAFPCIPPA